MEHTELETKIADLEKKIDRLSRMMVWAQRWGYIRILFFYVLPLVLIGWYALPFVNDVRDTINRWKSIGASSSTKTVPGQTNMLIDQYLRTSGISVDGICKQLCK